MQFETNTSPLQHTMTATTDTLCRQSELKSHPPSITKTSAHPKVTHCFTDNFYKYDLEKGTVLDDRSISLAGILWGYSGLLLSLFPAYIAGLIVSPIIFFAIPVCAAVVTIVAIAFFAIIMSNNRHEHARQVLGPITQEQADAVQCLAVEACTQKQTEINNLLAINASIQADTIDVLTNDSYKADGKDKGVLMNRTELKTRHAELFHQHLENQDEIRSLRSSIENLEKIYHLSVQTDNTGKVSVEVNQTVTPEDLPV